MDSKFEYDAFLSYSSKDEIRARAIWQNLTQSGLCVFWADQSLREKLGGSYVTAIQKALEKSKSFILYATENSIISEWVRTECETFYANYYLTNKQERGFTILIGQNFKTELLDPFYRTIQTAESVDDLISILVKKSEEQLASHLPQITNKSGKPSEEDPPTRFSWKKVACFLKSISKFILILLILVTLASVILKLNIFNVRSNAQSKDEIIYSLLDTYNLINQLRLNEKSSASGKTDVKNKLNKINFTGQSSSQIMTLENLHNKMLSILDENNIQSKKLFNEIRKEMLKILLDDNVSAKLVKQAGHPEIASAIDDCNQWGYSEFLASKNLYDALNKSDSRLFVEYIFVYDDLLSEDTNLIYPQSALVCLEAYDNKISNNDAKELFRQLNNSLSKFSLALINHDEDLKMYSTKPIFNFIQITSKLDFTEEEIRKEGGNAALSIYKSMKDLINK